MLILREDRLGLDAIDVAAGRGEHGLDVATIFFVIDGSEVFPRGAVGDFFRDAFENDGFIGAISADGAVNMRCDVLRFACVGSGAEPERPFPPNSPNQHEMRASIRPSGGDPIVVGFFEALKSPSPGL